ncbi:poly [ADP-ribose] polymerase 1-like [Penaeus monodon]|uniref:poly [ADP-ribose] polymerase 1-like n=1 Tax=Penaeus monodon TaxID=6687 RepID=UPI0018A747DC|nr:poly [ADP-ribose] polymerase 1-like [Penaeus monodon]
MTLLTCFLSEALKLISEKQDTKDDSSSSPSSSSSSTSSQARIKAQLLDCSNRFFTLIPHDFGMKKPPILDDLELIKAKVAMLDNLSEIEVVYNLLKSEGNEDKDTDPIDKHYGKLNTKIEVVDKKSDEFSMIKKYVNNTHASTHGHYKLVVKESCVSGAKSNSFYNEESSTEPWKSHTHFDLYFHVKSNPLKSNPGQIQQ